MAPESLLGHIALRISQKPENIATESLAYIVGYSPSARRALLGFINHNLPLMIPETVVFSTQESGPNGCIPDLVGKTLDLDRVVLIEAKFWAGLTDNQPTRYLHQLPNGKPAVLLFVAPALRLTTLWHEILKRCSDANLRVDLPAQQPTELQFAQVADCHILALTSWRALLDQMRASVNIEGDTTATSDLIQLQGLCERMDQTAFLPLQSEELTGNTASRILQYVQLVNDLTNTAVEQNLAFRTPNSKTSWSNATYWSPLTFHDFNCYLQVSLPLWARHRLTPIWLRVSPVQGKITPGFRDIFLSLERENPPGVLYDEPPFAHVPLTIPLGKEYEEVRSNLFQQIKKVVNLIAPHGI